ncbi:MAG: hypothetical protein Q9217_000788 [Psora testacea]
MGGGALTPHRLEESTGTNGTKEEDKSQQEHEWKQRGGEHKRHDAYAAAHGQSQKQANGDHKAEAIEYEKLLEKYTPQEIALLRSLQHKRDYISDLQQDDGKRQSLQERNRTQISIDEADQFSPDNWLPRSSDLIRLTGKHPLNAEPHLSHLLAAGLITPNELNYVRNHGAVPRLLWNFHQLDIENGKLYISMEELINRFDWINIPIALACDGNRRKGLNTIKKLKGFNWCPGAVSCAFWEGPLLRDVLIVASVQEQLPQGKRFWVNFEGADEPSEDNLRDEQCTDNKVLPSFVTGKDGEFAETLFRHLHPAFNEQNLNSVIVKPANGETVPLTEAREDKTYTIEGYAYDGGGHEVQRVELSLDDGETWLYCIPKPGGALSNILDCIPLGEQMKIRGPTGEIVYNGFGKFTIEDQEHTVERVSLVLGGSGITPGFSLIARIMLTKGDNTELRVIDANKSERDILLRDALDNFEKTHQGQIKITHVLNPPSEDWRGLKGHVNADIVKSNLFKPEDKTAVFLCGPPTMIQKAALPALKDWGYVEDENMFGF